MAHYLWDSGIPRTRAQPELTRLWDSVDPGVTRTPPQVLQRPPPPCGRH